MPVKARLIQLINIDDKIIKMVGFRNNKFETASKLAMLCLYFFRFRWCAIAITHKSPRLDL